ncbi:MAG: hypothetical protein DMD45_16950 [Gemmatimonadetes bacterium]|nr:MAG: hypothetical protein DMD45_16950 [Gemmatimonadota bacterium]
MGWTREVYQLPEDHGWTATPGHKILVLDAGAVVLEFPADWVTEPASGQVNVRDGATADDSSCVLAVSCLRIPSVDWSGLPLSKLLLDAIEGDDRDRIAIGPVRETRQESLTLAWTEVRVVDPAEHRECRSRICLARGDRVQCLITFEFWPEDEARFTSVWDHVLGSLRLGVRVDDPARGRRIG